jgi:hypothetical protein
VADEVHVLPGATTASLSHETVDAPAAFAGDIDPGSPSRVAVRPGNRQVDRVGNDVGEIEQVERAVV